MVSEFERGYAAGYKDGRDGEVHYRLGKDYRVVYTADGVECAVIETAKSEADARRKAKKTAQSLFFGAKIVIKYVTPFAPMHEAPLHA